jgi:hypothetical protein
MAVFSWQQAAGNWQLATGKWNDIFCNAVTTPKILTLNNKISQTILPDLFHSIFPEQNIRIIRWYLKLMNLFQLSPVTLLVLPLFFRICD